MPSKSISPRAAAQSLTARRRAVTAAHADYLLHVMRKVHGKDKAVDTEGLRALVENFREQHPPQGATKRQAALHEAGHLVAYEFDGMMAGKACIEGSPFGRGSWGGKAWSYDTPCTTPGPWADDPNEFLRDARGKLAGAIAEAVLGDGDAFSSFGELSEARLLVARAAELLGHDDGEVWRDTLLLTAAIVERYTVEIEEIADLLMRRRCVMRSERSTCKILKRVQPIPIDLSGVSQRSKELVQVIASSVPNFAALALGAR